MATYTREQLVKSVLQELCEVDENEAPEAAQFATVNDRCQQVMEGLYEDGFIPFDVDTTEIPGRYFLPIAWKVANTLVNTFSAQDRAQALADNDIRADRMLNKLTQTGYFATPTATDYF